MTATATMEAKVEGLMAKYPASKYAINTPKGMIFFAVLEFSPRKGVKVRYLRRLIGHPGEWLKIKMNQTQAAWCMKQLDTWTPLALAQEYAKEYTECARCGSPLSDPLSLERGIGPVCWEAFH